MRIGIAGPVSLSLLKPHLANAGDLGDGYSFPFTAHLALALRKRGHDVVVFALDPHSDEPRRFKGDQLTVTVGPMRQNGRARDYFAAERRVLLTAMREEQPELIHAHWTYEFALAALATGIPTIVTVHDWAPAILVQYRDPYRAVRLIMQTRVLTKARYLTAPSPHIAELVKTWNRKRAVVIPNGVPEMAFSPTLAKPLSPDQPIIVSAMNNGYSRRKNVIALLTAASLLRSRGRSVEVRLAGADYQLGGPAHRAACLAGMDEGVVYLGPVAQVDVPTFMSSSHLFVHPSLEESFGVVLVEAMAVGLPVVAGRSSGAVPWVVGPSAGRLVDVRSGSSIADAIEGLVDSGVDWAAASTAAHHRASQEFHLDRVVEMLEGEYEQVHRGRRHPAPRSGDVPSTRGSYPDRQPGV